MMSETMNASSSFTTGASSQRPVPDSADTSQVRFMIISTAHLKHKMNGHALNLCLLYLQQCRVYRYIEMGPVQPSRLTRPPACSRICPVAARVAPRLRRKPPATRPSQAQVNTDVSVGSTMPCPDTFCDVSSTSPLCHDEKKAEEICSAQPELPMDDKSTPVDFEPSPAPCESPMDVKNEPIDFERSPALYTAPQSSAYDVLLEPYAARAFRGALRHKLKNRFSPNPRFEREVPNVALSFKTTNVINAWHSTSQNVAVMDNENKPMDFERSPALYTAPQSSAYDILLEPYAARAFRGALRHKHKNRFSPYPRFEREGLNVALSFKNKIDSERRERDRRCRERKEKVRRDRESRGGERRDGERSYRERSDGERSHRERSDGERSDGERRHRERSDGEPRHRERSDRERSDGERRHRERSDGERRHGERSDSERRHRERSDGERRHGERSDGERRHRERSDGERRHGERSDGERRHGERSDSERRHRERSDGERRHRERKEKTVNGERRDGERRVRESVRADRSSAQDYDVWRPEERRDRSSIRAQRSCPYTRS
ncbi:apical junction molecule-like isoform X2 [Triplophysa rosa]|nr:apical junction molecule-like isoform X2 [Triplophysa rosa]